MRDMLMLAAVLTAIAAGAGTAHEELMKFVGPEGLLHDYWCRESHFDTGLAAYGDETVPWCDKVVLYLKDCGVTDAEIAAFRAIMLGGSK